MSPAPATLKPVAQNTGGRVGNRIEQQRDAERKPGERTGDPDHLLIVEQQEDVERLVLETLGNLSNAKSGHRAQGKAARRHDSKNCIVGAELMDMSAIRYHEIGVTPACQARPFGDLASFSLLPRLDHEFL